MNPIHQNQYNHHSIERKLQEFYAQNRIPHIIFYGPPASGKKHILLKFLKLLYQNETTLHSNVMYVNCAHGKGIKFIRDELKFFAKTNTQGVHFKSIVLLNAEHLTVDAQSAMRRCIEQYSNNTRFFIVIHNKSKLLVPILSRFCEIYVPPFLDAQKNPIVLTQHQYKNEFDLGKYELERNTTIGNSIRPYLENIHNMTHLNMSSLSTDLYEAGICVQDLLDWIHQQPNWTEIQKAKIGMEFRKVKGEFRSEKLLLLYVLDLVMRETQGIMPK
jgi:DNA polymerase III delta prime subunit